MRKEPEELEEMGTEMPHTFLSLGAAATLEVPIEEVAGDPEAWPEEFEVLTSDLDWVIIRENSEGEYAGHGGTTHGHSSNTVATEVSIFTRVGIERIFRNARPPG